MRLKEYLESHGIKKIHFAKRLGITPAWLHRLLKGQDCPVSLAGKIEEHTKGSVKIKDILETVLENKRDS